MWLLQYFFGSWQLLSWYRTFSPFRDTRNFTGVFTGAASGSLSLSHMNTVTPSRPVPVWRSLRNHILFLKCKSGLYDTSRLTWDDLPLDLACSVWLSVFHKLFSWHRAIYNAFGVSDWVTPRCLDYQLFHGYRVDTVFFVSYALRPKK